MGCQEVWLLNKKKRLSFIHLSEGRKFSVVELIACKGIKSLQKRIMPEQQQDREGKQVIIMRNLA